MSEKKKQDLKLMDFVFVGILLSACILIVWNTIQTQQVKTIAKYNKAHVCFLTDVIFGPVENMAELCDTLREDLHEEWQAQSR